MTLVLVRYLTYTNFQWNNVLRRVYTYALISVIFLTISCSQKSFDVAECSFVESIDFPLDKLRAPTNAKLYIEGNDSFILVLDQTRLKIFFYDLGKREITDSVSVKVFNHYVYIQNFEVLSRDSIILAFNPTYLADYHDQAVVLINRKTEIIGEFNFRGAHVLMVNDNKNVQRNFYFFSNFNTFPLIFKEGVMISPLSLNQREVFGEKIRQLNPYTLGKASLDTNILYKGVFTIDTSYSDVFFYSISKRPRGCLGYNNQIIFGRGYNSQLLYFDFDEEIIRTKWVDFVSVDTILPLTYNPVSYIDLSVPDFQQIYYDAHNRRYYRIARLPLNKHTTNAMHDFPQHSFVVLDEKLNKIAEGLLPFGCAVPLIPLNNGLLVWDKAKSFSNNRLSFKHLELKFTESDVKTFLKSIEKQFVSNRIGENISSKEYLKQVCNSISGFKHFILIDIDISCPSVLIKLGDSLSNNIDVFKRNRIALVLISKDKQAVSEYLVKHNLVDLENTFVFSDVNGIYKEAYPPWGNIKHIRKRNNRFVESHYASGDLNNLLDIIK